MLLVEAYLLFQNYASIVCQALLKHEQNMMKLASYSCSELGTYNNILKVTASIRVRPSDLKGEADSNQS